MKIMIQKKRFIAYLLVFVLTVSLLACSTITTHAAQLPLTNPVTSNKLIDMCLTRSGKVVNSDIREDVLTQTRNVLNDTATSYRQWCKDNGKSKSVETFREYLNSDAYATLPFRLAKFPLELASFIEWLINGETLLDVVGNDVNDVLTEHDEKGNVTVPSETVNIINQCFENVKGTYTSGWRYEEVYPVSDLLSGWFGTADAYANAKAYIQSSDNPTLIHVDKVNGSPSFYFSSNADDIFFVGARYGSYYGMYWLGTSESYGNKWTIYNKNWESANKYYKVQVSTSQFFVYDAETFEKNATTDIGYFSSKQISLPYMKYKSDVPWVSMNDLSGYMFFGKESGTCLVYDSLQAVKDYSLGNTPYYLTNRQYSDSVDNSFNVSGEYIQNNGGTFAYEQIKEQINNSNVTNDSTVSNIVNDYSQTIINNYNYSSGDNGNGGSGENGDNDNGISILDGLGKIVSAITDIIGFLLGVLGDVLSLVTSLLTTLFDMIKSLGSVFGSFSGLLGELFVFIPKEFIDLLSASLSIMVVVAIWKMIKK